MREVLYDIEVHKEHAKINLSNVFKIKPSELELRV